MFSALINPNPVLRDLSAESSAPPPKVDRPEVENTSGITEDLIYDMIKDIKDPEHPYTLEQLNVVREELIVVSTNKYNTLVTVTFTPTVPHCSLSHLIGLCIRRKLSLELPDDCKVDIFVTPGSLDVEEEFNKRINDKERVQAALESPAIRPVVEDCLRNCEVDNF